MTIKVVGGMRQMGELSAAHRVYWIDQDNLVSRLRKVLEVLYSNLTNKPHDLENIRGRWVDIA